MMDSKLKEKWITALRSGDYKQGRNYLHYIHKGEELYCSLGVLCEVSDVLYRRRVKTEDGLITYRYADKSGKRVYSAQRLPEGFINTQEDLKAAQVRIMEMNDGGGYTFEDIAEWIEKNL